MQTKTFETEHEARAWATVIEAEIIPGVFVSRTQSEATLIRDLLERYDNEVLPSKRGCAAD